MLKAKNLLVLSAIDGNVSIQNLDPARSGSVPDPEMVNPAASGPDPQNPPDIQSDPDVDLVHTYRFVVCFG